MFIVKNNHKDDSSNWSVSKHKNISMEKDFLGHLIKPEHFIRNTIDDEQVENDDEEGFTDLKSCVVHADNESDTSRSNSPVFIEDKQSMSVFYSLAMDQKHLESNKDVKNTQKNIIHQEISTSEPWNSYYLKSSDDILRLIHKDPYKFIFTAIPKEYDNYIQCRFICDKSGVVDTFYLEVELENDEKPITLLIAEKEPKILGHSQYLISLDPSFGKHLCSAELISNNLTGTRYTLYVSNEDQQQELAIIQYENNFLGIKGPRKINVLLPKFDHQIQTSLSENESEEYCSEESNNSFIPLCNKTPIWSDESGYYILQFDGHNRVTIPSIKNFQMLVNSNDHVEHFAMQFGRMTDDVFSCDFRYPLSFVQAFSIALSAFETRLFRD